MDHSSNKVYILIFIISSSPNKLNTAQNILIQRYYISNLSMIRRHPLPGLANGRNAFRMSSSPKLINPRRGLLHRFPNGRRKCFGLAALPPVFRKQSLHHDIMHGLSTEPSSMRHIEFSMNFTGLSLRSLVTFTILHGSDDETDTGLHRGVPSSVAARGRTGL